ncbi:MAG TPA: hypothetical protein VER96_23670 [Polyangiaceae bacterium]|nr:hypothetical protein [Polyangiaceae bacterium]
MTRTQRTQVGFWLLALTWALVGCGGRVIDDSGAGTVANGGSAPSGKGTGTAGKSGTSQPSTRLPSTQLGDCMPGFVRAENLQLPCRWLTESGLCFEKTEDACACICPIDRDSVCAHGFDGGPNDAKLVVCD